MTAAFPAAAAADVKHEFPHLTIGGNLRLKRSPRLASPGTAGATSI